MVCQIYHTIYLSQIVVNHVRIIYLFAKGFLDLLAHPCRNIRRVCILQQLLCFCIKHHRVSVRLLPAMQRYVSFRQNPVHLSDRCASSSYNLCNGCFLLVKFNNVFFCLCHLYYNFNGTNRAGRCRCCFLIFNPKLYDVFSVYNVSVFKLTIFIVVHL